MTPTLALPRHAHAVLTLSKVSRLYLHNSLTLAVILLLVNVMLYMPKKRLEPGNFLNSYFLLLADTLFKNCCYFRTGQLFESGGSFGNKKEDSGAFSKRKYKKYTFSEMQKYRIQEKF